MKTVELHKTGDENRAIVNLYTVAEAAKVLNVTSRHIYRWILDGALVEVPIHGSIKVIDGTSIMDLKQRFELNPPRRGRKPKAA